MLRILLFGIFAYIECATYPYQYDSTNRYPSSTVSSLYTNYPYSSGGYGSNIGSFPGSTPYPNYSPSHGYSSYSTSRYPNYNTNYNNGYSTSGYNSLYGAGSSNVNYNNNNQNYNLQRYGAGHGQSVSIGYNTGYSTTGYSTPGHGVSGYGSNFGSGYGTGLGSNFGSGYGSGLGNGYSTVGYGNAGYGNGLGTVYGSSYGTGGYSSYEAPFVRDIGSCVSRGPQNGIWIDSLMGMWYGVELIQHLGADPMIDRRESCIVIHISEPMDRPSTEHQLFHVQHINAKFRQEYRHLRLLWDEAGQTIEYALYFRNDSAGYWHVFEGQNGTIPSRRSYQQFSGTVQVLKAVNDHLLLNFCQEGGLSGRSPQLYSVLFSREPGALNQWEIEGIHSLLQTKKLSVASRRMVCGNSGAERPLVSLVFSVLTCILAYLISSS